jgi:hypothetical protein
MPVRYLATGRAAGQEISSTYEGRHLSIEEQYMTHPYHADGLVDKGDPVLIGDDIVGVALNSASAAGDVIAIDTEGIWFLNVLGTISDGTADGAVHTMAVGDQVYINRTAGTVGAPYMLSGQADPHNFVPFGYLLGDVTAHLTTPTLAAVKVHGIPTDWPNHKFGQYSGVFGDNAEIDLVAAKAAGQNQPSWLGIYVKPSTIMAASGDQVHAIKIRLEDVLASTGGDLQGIRTQVHCNNAAGVWTRLYGQYVAIANTASSAITESIGLAIAMGGAGAAPAMQTAFQVMGDGTLGTLQSWFQTEIGRGAGLKVQVQSLNQNSTHKIPINIDGTIYGIPVVAWA